MGCGPIHVFLAPRAAARSGGEVRAGWRCRRGPSGPLAEDPARLRPAPRSACGYLGRRPAGPRSMSAILSRTASRLSVTACRPARSICAGPARLGCGRRPSSSGDPAGIARRAVPAPRAGTGPRALHSRGRAPRDRGATGLGTRPSPARPRPDGSADVAPLPGTGPRRTGHRSVPLSATGAGSTRSAAGPPARPPRFQHAPTTVHAPPDRFARSCVLGPSGVKLAPGRDGCSPCPHGPP